MLKRLAEKAYRLFLSSRSSSYHEKKGIKNALSVFSEARKHVPAYQEFLSANNVGSGPVDSVEAFKQLPIVEKHNYLQKYSVEQLCLNGNINDKYLIEGSSGQSGERSYWPRSKNEDKDFPDRLETVFRNYYQIDKKPTLVIVALMLGVWVSGEKVSWILRQMAMNNKYPMTIITPGSIAEEIVDIVGKFSGLYEQTIILAYPPFMKNLTDLGEHAGIDWSKLNIKLLVGGEYFSEEWRMYMRKKFNHREDDLTSILGIYGASEMSTMMAQETRYSILVKRLAHEDPKLARDLFGQESISPVFCQYNPAAYYTEEIEDELVFTAMTAMPLVRYNIHDRGGVLSFDEVENILSNHSYDVMQMLAEYGYPASSVIKFPFLYVWGRSDGTALLYGAVIYPENIKTVLDNSAVSSSWTGLFRMVHRHDEEQNEYLQLKIELSMGVKANEALENRFSEIITSGLDEQNADFRALRKVIEDAQLEIKLYPYQDPEITQGDKVKHKYT